MKEVWWIRHGQSASNAGLRTRDNRSNPLTALGRLEARRVAEALEREPELIVTSPYVRTLQTAEPALERFPLALHEEWPVHEYTWLADERRRDTTFLEREVYAEHHFGLLDPHRVDGEGAESFVQFIGRVEGALERLRARPERYVVVFSHAAFIRAVLWTQFARPTVLDSKAMQQFLRFMESLKIPNASVVKMHLGAGDELFFSPPLTAHLQALQADLVA
ncbi:histidine phosphatase family protein [Calidithermus chliarophilus]|uniref:histidine phosphatase family protein n=1 Tax=Calidithermus chliarophilus TaxID=52023 RepID=UPI0004227E3F|nr:histidine phosphatase family protein [Calidithermus chliarophilus]